MKRLSQSISLISVIFILLVSMMMTGCGGTALTKAASLGLTEEVRAMLDKGADINERPYACEDGMTSLIGRQPVLNCAAYRGHTATVKLLLDRGADVNAKSSGTGGMDLAALAIAAWQGHTSTAKLLIERGADIDDAMTKLKNWGPQGSGGYNLLEKLVKKQQPASQPETIASKPSQEVSPVVKSDVDELPAIKAKPNKNAYAIVIGIEQYRQKLPKADYAVADAKTMTEYLTKVMGYPEENVVTLTNDRASLTDFIKYFEKWLPNNVEKDSSVFIYYSGHGAPNTKTGDAYLVPYDGDPSFIEQTGYPLKKLYESLNKLQAKEIIVALDSCFSGAGGKSVIAKGARPLVMNLEHDIKLSKNMIVMSASSGDQISSTYEEKGHGLFTYFLLKGIKDGITEIGELFDYLKPHVGRTARKVYNNEQTPQLIAPEKKKVFLRN